MDLSALSTEDLLALKGGDLSKVSTAGLQALKTAKTRETIDNDPISKGARAFNAGDSFLDNVTSGIGRGMTSVGRAVGLGGVAEKFGLPGTKEDADVTDRALMGTTGGKVGNVVGQAAAVAPAVLIPGANTLAGATLIGAGIGGLTTEGGLEDRAVGAAFGAGGGAAGLALGKGLGFAADKLKATQAYNALSSKFSNATRDTAAQNARAAGYVLPPTEVNPNMVTSTLEGLSGKIKTSQSASQRNQPITNDLVKKELGLPQNQPITVDALAGIRTQAGKAYDAVASSGTITPTPAYEQALDAITAQARQAAQGFPNAKANPLIAEIESLKSPQFDAAAAVAKIKSLRADSTTAYAQQNKELGKALRSGADALEDAIDTHLTAIGAPADLLKSFREARQTIAKTYTAQSALNTETGNISAAKLAAQLQKGKPLSGGLETVAKTASSFPKATQSLQQDYNALSPWDFGAGLASTALSGNPMLLAAPLARPAVRSALLSPMVQNRLAPGYGASTSINALQALMENDLMRRALPVAGALSAK